MVASDKRIPKKYQALWEPFSTDETLHHLTTVNNLLAIKNNGLVPKDPTPKYWDGMKAVFMAYSKDALYGQTQKHVLVHVKSKGEQLIRLYIKTNNKLYKSIDPKRTFQVISLEPINPAEIIKIEIIET